MAEETKQAEETLDTAKTKSTDKGENQEDTKTKEPAKTPQTIGEAVNEVTDILGDKEEPSEPLEKEEPVSETADETEDAEDVSSFLGEPTDEVKKTGEQKRIDKLTAKNYQLQAELDAAKVNVGTEKPAGDGEKVFTDSELNIAEKKAFDENDFDLMQSVRKEREKNLESKLVKKYQSDQNKLVEENKRIKSEWESTQEAYIYLSAPDAPKLYPDSNTELNIKDSNSNLFRLAKMLFMADSASIQEMVDNGHINDGRSYRGIGGQERAVADALKIIIRKRGTEKHEGKEVKKLKKKVKKLDRQRSLGSSGAEKAEDTTPAKTQTPAQILDEVISERKKYMAERSGLK